MAATTTNILFLYQIASTTHLSWYNRPQDFKTSAAYLVKGIID